MSHKDKLNHSKAAEQLSVGSVRMQQPVIRFFHEPACSKEFSFEKRAKLISVC